MKVTTIRMPESLYRDAKRAAKRQHVSLNRLFTVAIQDHMKQRAREAIDREFEGMATDPNYVQIIDYPV